MSQELLRIVCDMREVMQKERIRFGNRVYALTEGKDRAGKDVIKTMLSLYQHFKDAEEIATKLMTEMAQDYPIIDAMSSVRGVNKILAAQMVALIGDIDRFETVSKLWRYAGYAVIDGKAERPKRGEKLHYNKRLKTTCFKVGNSLLRSGSPYRQIYDQEKERQLRRGLAKGHAHYRAMRKMIKLFLAHLWEVWRRMEGLPTRRPYALDKLGHSTYIPPEQFGWQSLSVV